VTPAGVDEHWRQAVETWQALPALMDWSSKGAVATLHNGTVVQGESRGASLAGGVAGSACRRRPVEVKSLGRGFLDRATRVVFETGYRS
jgi:hypothetical protein